MDKDMTPFLSSDESFRYLSLNRQPPTHFIEVWENAFFKEQTPVTNIKLLRTHLKASITNDCKTIAVFKIRLKQKP